MIPTITPLTTIPAETYVVVDIIDGVAQTDTLHLPAPSRIYKDGERSRRIRFIDRIANGFPPSSWPAACGHFEAGSIYIQAGLLADKPICHDCASRAAHTPAGRLVTKTSILEILAKGPLTVAEIAERRGSTHNATAVAISKLKSKGHVEKVGNAYGLKAAA